GLCREEQAPEHQRREQPPDESARVRKLLVADGVRAHRHEPTQDDSDGSAKSRTAGEGKADLPHHTHATRSLPALWQKLQGWLCLSHRSQSSFLIKVSMAACTFSFRSSGALESSLDRNRSPSASAVSEARTAAKTRSFRSATSARAASRAL